MAREEGTLVGLDVGSTSVCAAVGEVSEEGDLQILATVRVPSRGLRKGVVVNIDAAASAIEAALRWLERRTDRSLTSVLLAIHDPELDHLPSQGIVPIRDEVRLLDVENAIEAARAVVIPLHREILHVQIEDFVVDGRPGIRQPCGMTGVRLEARARLFTASGVTVQNLVKCVQRAGLEVEDLVLKPFATARAVLTADELDRGVALIDMGGATTQLATFAGGLMQQVATLTIGGNHITSDIAIGLRTPSVDAERIKLLYGCASRSLVDRGEQVPVPSVGEGEPRLLSRQILTEIIEPRLEEIFLLARDELEAHGDGLQDGCGVVLCGGATSLTGVRELGEEVFETPVRMGGILPMEAHDVTGQDRSKATAIGLLLCGRDRLGESQAAADRENRGRSGEGASWLEAVARAREWFYAFFD